MIAAVEFPAREGLALPIYRRAIEIAEADFEAPSAAWARQKHQAGRSELDARRDHSADTFGMARSGKPKTRPRSPRATCRDETDPRALGRRGRALPRAND